MKETSARPKASSSAIRAQWKVKPMALFTQFQPLLLIGFVLSWLFTGVILGGYFGDPRWLMTMNLDKSDSSPKISLIPRTWNPKNRWFVLSKIFTWTLKVAFWKRQLSNKVISGYFFFVSRHFPAFLYELWWLTSPGKKLTYPTRTKENWNINGTQSAVLQQEVINVYRL